MQQGLTQEQVQTQIKRHLVNVQMDKSAKSTKDIVKENTLTYFNLIFTVIAILCIIAGSWNSLTFLPVIVANTLIGIVQQLHAKKVLDKLSILNEPNAKVVRDGVEKEVPIQRLVLGDIIHLTSGAQIPADARVVEGTVNVNEALLTGEADEIEKLPDAELMSGSFVVSGDCYAELIRVGNESYISKLMNKAKQLKSVETSEMIKSIDTLLKVIGVILIPIGIALFYQGFVSQGQTFTASVESMVAALIGMIPEGLYLLVSIALATSATKLATEHVMLHDMKSTETLARVDVLCVDKTGTITDNSMLVADVIAAREMEDEEKVFLAKLCSDYVANLSDNNITMQALRSHFTETTGRKAEAAFPFSSKYKYSSVQFEEGTFVLGAPEMVMTEDMPLVEKRVTKYAKRGNRVMIFGRVSGIRGEKTATGKTKVYPISTSGLSDYVIEPLFYICLQNPLRENAFDTFSYFAKQDVRVVVISGDSPLTVSEVAKKAGIADADKYVNSATLTSDKMIASAVNEYTVFGRTTPEQKQKIVKALKKAGHTVAMTGDGVNDILAMKSADCSIAMAAGSDAAAQAAQVVLLDSDFSHMPDIVGEGRRTINNIQRSATLFLVKNVFSILLALFSIINVLSYPLQPAQVSLISMFNIGIPAFFLAFEPNNKRVRGSFIKTVIIRAMPAALTDFFAIAALVVFGHTFGVSETDISVASTFLLAIVGFMILINISQPMNMFHSIVLGGCIVGLGFTAYFFNGLFDISYISTECIMLFVVFAIATEPCMRYLTRLAEWIEEKVTYRGKAK